MLLHTVHVVPPINVLILSATLLLFSFQVCVAIKRVFVHESKYEAMVDAMQAEAAKAKAVMNDGLDKDTRYGPINNRMQVLHSSSAPLLFVLLVCNIALHHSSPVQHCSWRVSRSW